MTDCSDAINDIIDAVKAIEMELGITPSTVYANVRARLDALEARINTPVNLTASNITINFGTVSATSRAVQTATITGAVVGSNVIVNPRIALAASIQIDYCRVSSTDTIEFAVFNRSGSGVVVNQAFDITVIS